jgi:predicted nucleic acid-binding protein
MIVLDTNVLSELTRSVPAPAVVQWARAQDQATIFTTAICEAELLYGLAVMPAGQRRAQLARAIQVMLNTVLVGRVLPFDRAAARLFGELGADNRQSGRTVGMADLQIAAIARARNADLIATRNVSHFAQSGVPLVDPWQIPTAFGGGVV